MSTLIQGQIKDTHGNGVPYAQISVFDNSGFAMARVYKDATTVTPTSAIFNADINGNYGPIYTPASAPIIRAIASYYVFQDGSASTAPLCLLDPTTGTGADRLEVEYGVVNYSSTYASLNAAVAAVPEGTIVVNAPTFLIASLSIPSGLTISIQGGGYIIKQGTSTLTFLKGSHYTNPDLLPSFSGFNPGDITFGAGVIISAKPAWWGITGTNDEVAVNCAVQSLSNGGVVQLADGTYNFQTNTVTYHSHITIRGVGGENANLGTGTLINTTLTNKAAFTSGSGVFYIGLNNLSIMSPVVTTGRHGIECVGSIAAGNALGFDIHNIGLFRLDKALWIHGAAHPTDDFWQYSGIKIEHSASAEGNIFVEMDAGNAELRSAFNYVGFIQKGFNINHAGAMTLEQTFGGAPNGVGGHFAGSVFIRINQTPATLTLIQSQAEQLDTFMLQTGAATYSNPINLIGCGVDAPVSLTGPVNFTSIGSQWVGGDLTATNCIVTSINDYWADGTEGGGVIKSNIDRTQPMFLTVINSAKPTNEPNTLDAVTTPVVGGGTAYSPVWAGSVTNPVLGNGTLTGRYRKHGTLINGAINFVAGTTTTFGSGGWTFTIPVASSFAANQTGAVLLYDSSAATAYAGVYQLAGSTITIFGPLAGAPFVTSVSPFTWATGDQLQVTFNYET